MSKVLIIACSSRVNNRFSRILKGNIQAYTDGKFTNRSHPFTAPHFIISLGAPSVTSIEQQKIHDFCQALSLLLDQITGRTLSLDQANLAQPLSTSNPPNPSCADLAMAGTSVEQNQASTNNRLPA